MGNNKIVTLTSAYIITYIGIFIFFSWGLMRIPSEFLEVLTAQTSSNIFNLLGFESSWSSNGQTQLFLLGEEEIISVYIIKECTAINVFGVILGLIIPLRASKKRKFYAILLSAGILYVMNISRIMLTLYLTGYTVPPFSWYFQSTTVETYHYPISFMYGVIGVAFLILLLDKWILPELGETLVAIAVTAESYLKIIMGM